MGVNEVYRSPRCDMHGYWAFTVKYSGGVLKTVFEHREIMEKFLGRKLRSYETIHHKDGNKKNNELSNLEIKSRSDHAKAHARKAITVELACGECTKKFFRPLRVERRRLKQEKHGPFCGKPCAGKWSSRNCPNGNWNKKQILEHGTNNTYQYHACRCVMCTDAHRISVKNWRNARASVAIGRRTGIRVRRNKIP